METTGVHTKSQHKLSKSFLWRKLQLCGVAGACLLEDLNDRLASTQTTGKPEGVQGVGLGFSVKFFWCAGSCEDSLTAGSSFRISRLGRYIA